MIEETLLDYVMFVENEMGISIGDNEVMTYTEEFDMKDSSTEELLTDFTEYVYTETLIDIPGSVMDMYLDTV